MGESRKNCNHCGFYLPEQAFSWRFRLLGTRHKICRKCQKEHQKVSYEKHKANHLANVKARGFSSPVVRALLGLGINIRVVGEASDGLR